ncbi:MAG: PTS sugar transporter subunit IIA [Spirochaetales bacterium]
MFISELFPAEWILPDLKSRNKDDLFKEICGFVAAKRESLAKELLLENLWQRERQMTTGIALGVALPHTNIPGLGETIGVLGLSRQGIEYNSLDGEPVHVVFFLLGDLDSPDEHIHVLKHVALLLINPEFFPTLIKCRSPKEITVTLRLFEQS